MSLLADIVFLLGVAFFSFSTTVQIARLRRRLARLERRHLRLVFRVCVLEEQLDGDLPEVCSCADRPKPDGEK